MKEFKKICCMLACLAIVILLVSCGGSENASVNENGLPYRKLKVLYPFVTGEQRDKDLVLVEVNKYLKEKINVEISIEGVDFTGFNSKYPLMLQTNEQLDLMWGNSDILIQNIAKQAFVPLDELLAQYGNGVLEVFDENALEAMKMYGKLYAIAVNKELALNNGTFFDDEVARRNGIDYANIRTYADMDAALAKIKANEPNIVPLFMSKGSLRPTLWNANQDPLRFEEIQGNRHLQLDTETNKIISRYENPYNIEWFKQMRDWHEKGYINQDAAITSLSQGVANKNGQAWITIGSGKPGQEDSYTTEYGRKYGRGAVDPIVMSGLSVTSSMVAIPHSSADKERTMMLLNLIYTDEYLLNLIQFGIEDMHYVKINDNTIGMPPGFSSRTETGYYPATEWVIGNQYLNYLFENEAPNKVEQYKEYNKEAIMYKSTGFIFEQSDIKTELGAINTIIEEFLTILEFGIADTDTTLASLNEKLKATGMTRIIEEAQKQYDAWLIAQ